MGVLIFFIVAYLILSISLFKIFEKAGEEAWKALVPGWNFAIWCKIIGRSPWWALWLLFPIVNIFIYAGMAVDMVRSFGKYKFWHSAGFFQIGFTRVSRKAVVKQRYHGNSLRHSDSVMSFTNKQEVAHQKRTFHQQPKHKTDL